ncbi:MAG TPA: HD domain-containing phosphohydrolase [Actinomycetota bacterium]|nr:HD domain-containing phosphohydrolase [Actinomycetota bacterium]
MPDERVRLAEIVASLSMVADIALGDPIERALRSTLITLRLGERAGLDDTTLTHAYYVSMLTFIGCTSEQHLMGRFFGDEHRLHEAIAPLVYGGDAKVMRAAIPLMSKGRRGPAAAVEVARTIPALVGTMNRMSAAHCEVAQLLSDRLGVDPSLRQVLGTVFEQWDGKGGMKALRGEEVPVAVRLASIGRDAEWQRARGDAARVADVMRARAGKAHDPEFASLCAAHAEDLVSGLTAGSMWDEVLACEPGDRPELAGEQIDLALEVFADFVDMKSPYFRAHSRGVAALASGAAERCGFATDEVAAVRRAALVHDIGRVAVSVAIWDRSGPLSADDVEKVRLHAYHAERVFSRAPLLASIGRLASMHHERLDGSGYHRAVDGGGIPPGARIIAAADAYHAMTEQRPHRAALDAETAAKESRAEADAGRLDGEAVGAVLAAAGHKSARGSARAAGLTSREVEVLRLVARGMPTKAIARALDIAPKTADNHIQRIYAKCGVSTRAGATLFAMQSGVCSDVLG